MYDEFIETTLTTTISMAMLYGGYLVYNFALARPFERYYLRRQEEKAKQREQRREAEASSKNESK